MCLFHDEAALNEQLLSAAKVKRAIIDKEAKIRANALVGYDLERDRIRGCTISDNGVVVVPRGMELIPV